jgi:serine/threonine-protein kinase
MTTDERASDQGDDPTRSSQSTTPSGRWRELQRVVDGALDRPRADRAAYLDETCGTNTTLRDEAERLLNACERAERAEGAGGLLDARAAAFAAPLLAEVAEHTSTDASARAALTDALRAALAGRYAVERELGHGGMATVYLARDLRHDRAVAVKVVERGVAPTAAARFLREVRIAARLTHPHVLGLHDSGEVGGLLYYVMPYVEGETLRERMTREGAPSLTDAVRLLRELADALAYAHAHGVVHRDLKPENVLLAGGHAVVADFGIAKALADATQGERAGELSRAASLTGTGISLGTPAYMAPEQASGEGVDHRADLYALGVIAYELIGGAHPFAGRSSLALVAAHLSEAPAPLSERRPDVPPTLAALVAQLMAKNPADRPPSAEAVLRTLEGVPATSGRAVVTRRRAVFALAMLLLLLGTGGYLVWRGASPPAAHATHAPTTIRSLAVLPFANQSDERQDDYFSDGLTDELAHALAQLPRLRLAGRTGSYAFKGRGVSAQEVGRVLGVDAFVSATVRRSGDRLRVNPQLVSTSDGSVLWDSVYESRSGDVFAVQDSLTRAVVAALAPTLGIRDDRSDSRPLPIAPRVGRGTANADAYELYLKGMYYWHERGAANLNRAIALFQQAIGRDPTFARAYAALTFAYSALAVYVPDLTDSTTSLIEASARRAITLDSTLADAQLAIALALGGESRFHEAERHFRAAIGIEPTNYFAHQPFGMMLLEMGRMDEAISELRQATRLDPLAKSAGTGLAEALMDGRRFRDAEAESRRVLAIDTTFPLALYSLGLALAFDGQPDSAVRTLERGLRLYPEFWVLKGRLLFAYAAAGRWSDVERMRAELRRPGGDPSDGALPAFADYVLGDRAALLRLVETPAGRRAWFEMLRPTARGTGCNPLVDPLWTDARYQAAMRGLVIASCPAARRWPLPARPTS